MNETNILIQNTIEIDCEEKSCSCFYKSEADWERILKSGDKLPKAVAEVLFPFSKTHRWRA